MITSVFGSAKRVAMKDRAAKGQPAQTVRGKRAETLHGFGFTEEQVEAMEHKSDTGADANSICSISQERGHDESHYDWVVRKKWGFVFDDRVRLGNNYRKAWDFQWHHEQPEYVQQLNVQYNHLKNAYIRRHGLEAWRQGTDRTNWTRSESLSNRFKTDPTPSSPPQTTSTSTTRNSSGGSRPARKASDGSSGKSQVSKKGKDPKCCTIL